MVIVPAWEWDKSIDEEDVATLEPFSELPESDVLKLMLPPCELRGDGQFRCCRKDTFTRFSKTQKYSRWAHSEQLGETLSFSSTALVGIDMLDYDIDFAVRFISESENVSVDCVESPAILHVSSVQRIEPQHVKDPVDGIYQDHRQQVVVNLHRIEEAEHERLLWRALDDAMACLTHGKCPLGHRLRPIVAPVPWVCDGCERHFTRAAKPRRCAKGCDFDLCVACDGRSMAVNANEVVIEFQKNLEDIKSRGRGFKLPVEPPRATTWNPIRKRYDARVSDRVTKWNAVTLDAACACSVRQTFLAAYGVDPDSEAVGWTFFRPGTGAPMRRSVNTWSKVAVGRFTWVTRLVSHCWPSLCLAILVAIASRAVWELSQLLRQRDDT